MLSQRGDRASEKGPYVESRGHTSLIFPIVPPAGDQIGDSGTTGEAVVDTRYVRQLPGAEPRTGRPLAPFVGESPENLAAVFISNITTIRGNANGKTVAHELAHVILGEVDGGPEVGILRGGPEPENTFLKKRFTGAQRQAMHAKDHKYVK